jgi:hypothetical protein
VKRMDTPKVYQTPKNAESKKTDNFSFANNFKSKSNLHPIKTASSGPKMSTGMKKPTTA